jgi:hypothetical protein
MTLKIMTLSIAIKNVTLCNTTLNIMTLMIMTLSKAIKNVTLGITTLNTMTFSIMPLMINTLSIAKKM